MKTNTDQKNKNIIDQMERIFRFGKSTRITYEQDLMAYSKFHKMSLEELLEEAEEEEEQNIRKRKRKINQRIFDFQDYLMNVPFTHEIKGKVISRNYQPSSVNKMMRTVKTMYSAFEIETPRLKPIPCEKTETYEDVITYDMIRKAISNTSNLKHKAIIEFMASSGLDSNDVQSMTVKMFMNACKTYLSSDTIEEQLMEILELDNIIPCFRFKRGKTMYDHFTFCTPEAAHSIAKMLLRKKEINEDDSLFGLTMPSFRKVFSNLNDRCGFGWTSKGTRRMFHGHGLRTFFASQLVGSTINGVMIDSMVIEWFLGHKVPTTTESYYKRNPQKLKEIYANFIPKLTFENTTNMITVESPEFEALKKELEQYQEVIKDIEEIKKLKQELQEQYNNL